MRCRSGLQCLDQTQLCTRSKMRVDDTLFIREWLNVPSSRH